MRSDVQLNRAVNTLRNSALASSTRATYNTGIRLFLVFCAMYGIMGIPDACEDLFVYFVTHCHCRLKLRFGTIRTALAGIRFLYIDRFGYNPFVTCNGQPMLRLHLIFRAIKRDQGAVVSHRLSITYSILSDFIQILRQGVFGPYIDLLMQAVCLLAFFGFLRCAEFTQKVSSSDPQSYIRMTDIVIQSESVSVRIKSSKTDPFRQGTWVHLYQTGRNICPVRTLKVFFKTRLLLGVLPDSNAPYFALTDGRPLTRYKFVVYMKELLARIGCHGDAFTPHSFRKGAATSASAGHIPDHIITHLGRWSSDCYQMYITLVSLTVHRTPCNQWAWTSSCLQYNCLLRSYMCKLLLLRCRV
jgi:hypothetical protein